MRRALLGQENSPCRLGGPRCLGGFELQFAAMSNEKPLVGIIMGSKSDWDAMKAAGEMLSKFGVAHESRVMSAHRTPAVVADYASGAAGRGMEIIIAGAGGAAHLAGVVA